MRSPRATETGRALLAVGAAAAAMGLQRQPLVAAAEVLSGGFDAVLPPVTDTLASAVLQARLKLISREDLQWAISDARSAAVSEIAIAAAEALLSKLPAVAYCSSQDWLVKSASLARAEMIGQGSFGTVFKVQVLSGGSAEWLAEKFFPVKTEAATEREALEQRLRQPRQRGAVPARLALVCPQRVPGRGTVAARVAARVRRLAASA